MIRSGKLHLLACLVGALGFSCVVSTSRTVTPPADAPAPTPQAAAPSTSAPAPDQATQWRAQKAAEVLETIKGRENEPAEAVFKNIQVLKGVPAGRLVRIMEMGWGRALGVGCGHCHVVDDWANEQKNEKQITREMAAMTGRINEQVRAIPNLSPNPSVNCTTCHRGQVKPALDLGS